MVEATVSPNTLNAQKDKKLVLWFEEVGISDIPLVGGKMHPWEK
jgi:hypothetical protein